MSKTKDLQAEIKELKAKLAYTETDPYFSASLNLQSHYTSRNEWDRQKILAECLKAWRVNPIARRIVKMITSFTIGNGLKVSAEDQYTNAYLQKWWTDPQNNFQKNFKRWMDEQTRSGNHFFLFSVINDTSYVRAVSSDLIKDIETTPNDIEQETTYIPQNREDNPFPAYDQKLQQDTFMLHYAVNQPIGNTWGEPDLAPILQWLGRYSTMLEDRVRLNHFRSSIMYILKMKGTHDEATRRKRADQMNQNPPRPGTVFVQDDREDLGILSANLDAFDATMDSETIKKMIAVGTPFPLHYLAEPESATRTTAEASGTPTFRALQDVQDDFFQMLKSMAQIALQVRARFDKKIKVDTLITISGADITQKDNANLALAASRLYPTVIDLFDRDMLKEQDVLRLTYRFIDEVFDGKVTKGKKRPLKDVQGTPEIPPPPDPIEPNQKEDE